MTVTGIASAIRVRPREPVDMPVLCALLTKQRAVTGYPERWPLPFPLSDFIHRGDEDQAWVAELNGAIVGHIASSFVAPTGAGSDKPNANSTTGLGELWADEYGCDVADLRCISTVFTDAELAGAGVGSALLRHAVARIREDGHMPVLDYIKGNDKVMAFYKRRGWVDIAERRAPWDPEQKIDVVLMILPELRRVSVTESLAVVGPAPADTRERRGGSTAVGLGQSRFRRRPGDALGGTSGRRSS